MLTNMSLENALKLFFFWSKLPSSSACGGSIVIVLVGIRVGHVLGEIQRKVLGTHINNDESGMFIQIFFKVDTTMNMIFQNDFY